MKNRYILFIAFIVSFIAVTGPSILKPDHVLHAQSPNVNYLFPGEERHLSNARMLTNGGENAEAYFDMDGRKNHV